MKRRWTREGKERKCEEQERKNRSEETTEKLQNKHGRIDMQLVAGWMCASKVKYYIFFMNIAAMVLPRHVQLSLTRNASSSETHKHTLIHDWMNAYEHNLTHSQKRAFICAIHFHSEHIFVRVYRLCVPLCKFIRLSLVGRHSQKERNEEEKTTLFLFSLHFESSRKTTDHSVYAIYLFFSLLESWKRKKHGLCVASLSVWKSECQYRYVQHISTNLQLWLALKLYIASIKFKRNAERSKCERVSVVWTRY